MLIELINISHNVLNLQLDIDRRNSIEAIFNSHGARNHLVISDVATLDWLLDVGSEVFGMTTMSYIRDARDLIRETTNIKNSLGIYLQVDFSQRYQPRHSNTGVSDLITVGYNYFLNSQNSTPTLLVGEHLNDAKLYNSIAQHYAKHTIPAGLNVAFEAIHGGGSTTKTIFDDYKNQNRLTFCVLDTDKKFPNDSEKNTSTNFSTIDRRLNRSVKSMIINAHEIESIIPLDLIIDMMNSTDSTYGAESITKAEALEVYSSTDFRRFFDHKNGINLREAIEHDSNNREDYWLNFLGSNSAIASKACYVNKECSDCNSCPKVNGLGDGLLNSVVEFTQRNSTKKYSTKMESFIRNEWESIGKQLLGWGCVSSSRVGRSS
ncbi:hypothetical protein AB6D92_12145 [Vibrio splendidus]